MQSFKHPHIHSHIHSFLPSLLLLLLLFLHIKMDMQLNIIRPRKRHSQQNRRHQIIFPSFPLPPPTIHQKRRNPAVPQDRRAHHHHFPLLMIITRRMIGIAELSVTPPPDPHIEQLINRLGKIRFRPVRIDDASHMELRSERPTLNHHDTRLTSCSARPASQSAAKTRCNCRCPPLARANTPQSS